jgi:hypothetical protein
MNNENDKKEEKIRIKMAGVFREKLIGAIVGK